MTKILLVFLFIFSCSSLKKEKDLDQSIKRSLEGIGAKSFDYGVSGDKKDFLFKDKTEEYGLKDIVATNFNAIDFSGDGITDLVIIPEYYAQPLFYKFDVKLKKFIKVPSLFSNKIKASYLIFDDFNRDGVLDALVGVLNQKTELDQNPVRILYGELNRFSKLKFVKEKRLFTEALPTSSVVPLDYDLDGDLDFYIANWFTRYKNKPLAHKDFFIINDNEKYISDKTKLVGEEDKNLAKKMFKNATPTIGAQACDIDQNGYPDILGVSTNGFPNSLWMNRFKFRKDYRYFKNYGIVSRYSGDMEGSLTQTGGGRTFSVACADYNNDSIMDAFLGEVTHSYDSDMKDKSSILTGARKKFPPVFYRTEYVLDAHDTSWTQADKRAVWFDYNNDGLLDLLVDNSGYPPHSRLILFKQYPDHSFENVAKEVGIDFVNPQSSIVIDLNNDGRLDIITSQANLRDAKIKRRVFVFENQIKNLMSSLKVKLKGKKSNPNAIGATVMARVKKADGKLETRTQVVSYSYGALPPQNEQGIHFGLSENEELIYLKVRWPYAKELNQSPQSMEKIYRLNIKNYGHSEITLCEGRGRC